MSNGIILYEGPSMLDTGVIRPIVAIATGLKTSSANSKTGAMIQTWILAADVDPVTAARTGADQTVCGDCPHRGVVRGINGELRNVGRSCYVTLHQAPLNVWKTWRAGKYPAMTDNAPFAKRAVRFGSYGDPAAVPFGVWRQIATVAAYWTGYTHQWRTADLNLRDYCMASVDSEEEAREAQAVGWRTFRVRSADSETVGRELVCPASEEAGKTLTCAQCRACGGILAGRKADVAIVAHGSAGKRNAFEARS